MGSIFFLSTPSTFRGKPLTCCELHLLGHHLVVDNWKLRELNFVHTCYCTLSSIPVKLNVIGGVAIWNEETAELDKGSVGPEINFEGSRGSEKKLPVIDGKMTF